MTLVIEESQRKSAPYIPSWPLLPPDEPCVRFSHLVWSKPTEPTIECIQQEKKRVITLWNELKEEDRQVYYKEYEDDLETFWRLHMVICGCHICKEEVSKYKGSIDVTNFINQLKHSQDRNTSQNYVQTHMQTNAHCGQSKQIYPETQKRTLKETHCLNFIETVCHDTSNEKLTDVKKFSIHNGSLLNCVVEESILENAFMKTNPKQTDELQQELTNEINTNFQSIEPFCHETQAKELSSILPTSNYSVKGKSNCYDSQEVSLSSKSNETSTADCEVSKIRNSVTRRGYPFTTSNCMDFSGDESDISDEVSFRCLPTTLLSGDRSTPNLTSDQHLSVISNSCLVNECAESPHVAFSIEDNSLMECCQNSLLPAGSSCISISSVGTVINDEPMMVASDYPLISSCVESTEDKSVPGSLLPAASGCTTTSSLATSVNDEPSSTSITCLPSSDNFADQSQSPLVNQEIGLQTNELAFLEIKRICIKMILEKLRYFKSLRMEKETDDQVTNIDSDIGEVNNESNLHDSCLPEFVPINNTFRQCTWELRIENEARKNYNRKVTLKFNWTSKGGEPIKCLDSKGVELDVRSMQPFVRLKPLKSLKSPIVLKIRGNNIFSRLERKRVDFRPKRRLLRKSVKFCQFRLKENVKIGHQRNKREQPLDRPVVCDVCNAGFTGQQALVMHMASCKEVQHTRGKSLESIIDCSSLTCRLDGKNNVAQHCSVCAGSFTDHILREIHMLMAHKTNRARVCCNICGFTFRNNASYFTHIVEHQKLQCVVCKNLFETAELLEKHLTFDHLEFTCYCKKCDCVLPTIVLYQDHMLGHMTIRPFSCSVCSKRFKRKYNLVGHMWTHKPHGYKCMHCKLSFPRPHLFNAHNRKFHGLSGIE